MSIMMHCAFLDETLVRPVHCTKIDIRTRAVASMEKSMANPGRVKLAPDIDNGQQY
jgi:hypothetical protein